MIFKKDYIDLPVIGIKEGEKVATVNKVLIDKDKKTLDYLILDVDGKKEKGKLVGYLPFDRILGIGDFAVMIPNSQMIKIDNDYEHISILARERSEVINLKAISLKGNYIGIISAIEFDSEIGVATSILLKLRDSKEEQKIPASKVLSIGNEFVIVNEMGTKITQHNSDSDVKPMERKEVMHQADAREFAKGSVEEDDIKDENTKNMVELHSYLKKKDVQTSNKMENSNIDDSKVGCNASENNIENKTLNFNEKEVKSNTVLEEKSSDPIQEDLLIESLINEHSSNSGMIAEQEEEYQLDTESMLEEEGLLTEESLFGEEDMLPEENLFAEENLLEAENLFAEEDLLKAEKMFAEETQMEQDRLNNEIMKQEEEQLDKVQNSSKNDFEDFFKRQKGFLIGKTILKDICDENGNMIVESGTIITNEIFDLVKDTSKDSIVELAMFSK